ncbi:ATP-binding cassette domain-containing protein [Nocardioides sambongensis]|uniref:ATP-binding cassette domain-containing protein n=1 Tax=Nocardioides sambongensis TaxID=2589074 RepID=UPI0018C88B44|nr:ATP-binding cassette domain-containing protein [Nocardioides sambongensis]
MTIELDGVGKTFGRTDALAEVSLRIGAGVTGLLGPNGAGKTTLLRIAATSIASDRGRVELVGRDPYASHADLIAVRRELGYLPQELGYPSDMTAFGFVEYVAVLKEWNDRRARHREVRRVLELTGLADLAGKRVARLSGGQRRRVGLAQALLGRPRLLLLDEPTTGLDPTQRAQLRRTLSVLGSEATVVLSTHQTEDVAALCERVIVLADGRVRFDGSVTDLVGTAAGRVWLTDREVPDAVVSWRTGTGRHRVVGDLGPTWRRPLSRRWRTPTCSCSGPGPRPRPSDRSLTTWRQPWPPPCPRPDVAPSATWSRSRPSASPDTRSSSSVC